MEKEIEQKEIDEYYKKLKVMTKDEKEEHYKDIGAAIGLMEVVLDGLARKELEYYLKNVLKCAENGEWKKASEHLADCHGVLFRYHFASYYRSIWERTESHASRDYMDIEYLRLKQEMRKLRAPYDKS